MAKLTFTDQSYFSRDWAMLTRDKGWIKPILLMALASLVPIVGILGVTGYAYEWARLTAWGVDSAPKQRDVKVGACIKSGFRVCMVTLCWSLAVGFVFGVLNVLCGDSALGSLVSMLTTLLTWVAGILATVAALQATIYERFGAGFAVRRLVEMIRRGWKGLLKVLGINLVIALVSGLIGTVITLIAGVATLPFLGNFLYDVSYAANAADLGTMDYSHTAKVVGGFLQFFGPFMVVVIVLAAVLGAFTMLLTANLIGLWMMQFDVPNWGSPSDPLPASLPDAGAAAVATVNPAAVGPVPMASDPAPVRPAAPASQAPIAPAPTVPTQADPAETPVPVPTSAPVAIPTPVESRPAPAPLPVAIPEPVNTPVQPVDPVPAPAVKPISVPAANPAPADSTDDDVVVTTLIPAPADETAVVPPVSETVAVPVPEPVKKGAEVGQPAPQKAKFCINCGSPLNPGVKFCSTCGQMVDEAE